MEFIILIMKIMMIKYYINKLLFLIIINIYYILNKCLLYFSIYLNKYLINI